MDIDKTILGILAGAGVISGAGGGSLAYSQDKVIDKLEAKVQQIKAKQQSREVDSVRAEEQTKAAIDKLTTSIELLSRKLDAPRHD